jgi:hypothetical protein
MSRYTISFFMAMLVVTGLATMVTSPGGTTPLQPSSLSQPLKQVLLLKIKKHQCDEGCWGCRKGDCLKHKHTTYCETPPAKAECCTKWQKTCYCSQDFCTKQ